MYGILRNAGVRRDAYEIRHFAYRISMTSKIERRGYMGIRKWGVRICQNGNFHNFQQLFFKNFLIYKLEKVNF